MQKLDGKNILKGSKQRRANSVEFFLIFIKVALNLSFYYWFQQSPLSLTWHIGMQENENCSECYQHPYQKYFNTSKKNKTSIREIVVEFLFYNNHYHRHELGAAAPLGIKQREPCPP